jgi:hypothetical protein
MLCREGYHAVRGRDPIRRCRQMGDMRPSPLVLASRNRATPRQRVARHIPAASEEYDHVRGGGSRGERDWRLLVILQRGALWASVLLVLVASGRLDGAQTPSPPEMIGVTAAKLRAVDVADYETDVSPAVIELLTRFKHQIRETVVAAVAGEAADASAGLVQQSILHALRREGIGPDTKSDGYGNVAAIEVERPGSDSRLLVVTTARAAVGWVDVSDDCAVSGWARARTLIRDDRSFRVSIR